MKQKTKKDWLITILFAISSIGLIFTATARAQDPSQDEEARRLWDSEFLKKRTPAKTSTSNPAPARKVTGYRRVTPKTPAAENKPVENKPVAENKPAVEKVEGEVLGVTIWRLRRSTPSDAQESRLLLEETASGNQVEWTLERVESGTGFAAGDFVKLGIESPRDGYLYVIDRELYADGTMSDPYLIYPTLRNRNGDNSVSAGKVIELPGRTAFRLKSTRQDYAGENLTVLVTQQPLAEITVGEQLVKLDKAQVEAWEKQWGVHAERFELIGGAGKPYTKAEKEAGQEGARILTQEDELPQTLYRVVTKTGSPLLVTVPLRIKK